MTDLAEKLIQSLENLQLIESKASSLMYDLSTYKTVDHMKLAKAYFHRLLLEYGAEAMGFDVKAGLIDPDSMHINVIYFAHLGQKFHAYYICRAEMCKVVLSGKGTRCVCIGLKPEEMKAIELAVSQNLHPTDIPEEDHMRTICSVVAKHSKRIMRFLDPQVTEIESDPPTPAEPVFESEFAAYRPYTF